MEQLQTQSQYKVLLVIHGTTMILLQRMYDEDELVNVVSSFVQSLMDMDAGEVGYPFFIMQFGEEPPNHEPSPDPTESYIWN